MVEEEEKIRVNCLGRLEIYFNGKEQSMRMNSAKARELIAFLMTYKGAAVSKGMVCEALWEEIPIEFSKDCLYKLLKRIKDMPIPFHIESKRGMLQLRTDNIESDIFLFDELTARKQEAGILEKLVDLYIDKGSLFEEESYGWINMKAAPYEKKYMDTICFLEEYYEKNDNRIKTEFYKKLTFEYA